MSLIYKRFLQNLIINLFENLDMKNNKIDSDSIFQTCEHPEFKFGDWRDECFDYKYAWEYFPKNQDAFVTSAPISKLSNSNT